MSIALAILANIISIFASLMLVVMLLAGGANSKPEQITQIKRWMFSIFIIAAAGLMASIWLMVVGKPWHGAGAGIAPTVYVIGLFIYLLFAWG